jgi:hypothetical protein
MNSYMKGFNPSVLVATVEAIEWDGWDYLG